MRNFWMNLLAVVVGYLVMAIGIGVIFSVAYIVYGRRRGVSTGLLRCFRRLGNHDHRSRRLCCFGGR